MGFRGPTGGGGGAPSGPAGGNLSGTYPNPLVAFIDALTTAGDLPYAINGSTLGRVAVGNTTKTLRGGAIPAYGYQLATPALWNAPAVNDYTVDMTVLSTADVLVNRLVRVPSTVAGSITLLTPTAAALIAALTSPAVGDVFAFTISSPQPSFAIILDGSLGVTVADTATASLFVDAGVTSQSRTYYGRITNVVTPAVEVY